MRTNGLIRTREGFCRRHHSVRVATLVIKLHFVWRLELLSVQCVQFGQLLLYQLLVPVQLRARGQELLDFRSILDATDWPILESSQLLILELADTVF